MVSTYDKGLRGATAVPTFEPTPLTATHNIGGQAHVADDWMRLDRFLVIGTTGGTYYVGERDHTLENLDVVRRCVAADGVRVVNRIVEISHAGRAPKQDPCIAAFAVASVEGDTATKRAVYANFGKVLRIPTHQMHFARFREAVGGGWGAGLRRAYSRLFNDATAKDLAYDAVKYQSRDGWALWDLIRLARPTPSDAAHDALYRYIKDGTITTAIPDETRVFLEAVAELKGMTSDPRGASVLIDRYRIPREAVPSELLTSPLVWSALLPSMGITALLRNLGNLAKHGVLAQGSDAERFVVGKVQDADVLRKGRVHPISVLVALKVYEQGKSVKGDGVWTATRRIVTALNEAFYTCYGNVEPTGKRIRVALDTSNSMTQSVLGMDYLSAREAEAAIALVFLNTEQSVDLLGYSDYVVDLNPLIKPATTIQEAMRILGSFQPRNTFCSLPVQEAIQSGRDFDAFVSMTDSETSDRNGVSGYLRQYRQQVGHRVTHSVLAFTATDVTIGDPNDPHVLNCAGFDAAVPQLVADFIAGR